MAESNRLIIGIVGVAGSGKVLVARKIEAYGFRRMQFTAPIREMLLTGLGMTEEQLDGAGKEDPLPQFGHHSARHLIRTLATGWGRNMVSPDLWVNIWRRRVHDHPGNVVVDDIRSAAEANAVKAMGGTVWRIYRPGLVSNDQSTERLQADIEEDLIIANATSLVDLDRSVEQALVNLALEHQHE